ncbi:hypothetical protein TorRG33x02_026690, partial [Trema orientale]
ERHMVEELYGVTGTSGGTRVVTIVVGGGSLRKGLPRKSLKIMLRKLAAEVGVWQILID